ncbi:MAG: chromosomal replication initiator protein DnaA [Lactobacillales bacterium]|jgi:chromosomal replication initiator protein|nr:chromosomal replication initiator protein DnaA [Lactobacillales bacterium]
MVTIDQFWNRLVDEFATQMQTGALNNWVHKATPVSFAGNTLTISVPSDIMKRYWESKLVGSVLEVGFELTGDDVNLVVNVESSTSTPAPPIVSAPIEPVHTTDFNNFGVTSINDSKDKFNNIPSDFGAYYTEVSPQTDYYFEEKLRAANLSEQFTFTNYVVGENEMVYNAALSAAERPGQYNPLFIRGNSGLGKTHLLKAIGYEFLKQFPNSNVYYTSTESFMNEFTNTFKDKTQAEFREKYRNLDLLLIDDIQLIGRATQSQEEFFNTFNALADNGKQIVIASDSMPLQIRDLADRLRTRFVQGLNVEVLAPGLDTRIAILQNISNADNIVIPSDALVWIAQNFSSDVRTLKGALNTVMVQTVMMNRDIDLELVQNSLAPQLGFDPTIEVTMDQIQKAVADSFGVTIAQMNSKSRKKEITTPRHISFYLMKELLHESYPNIAKKYKRDHTTIMNSYKKAKQMLDAELDLRDQVDNIKQKLGTN